MNLLVLLVLNVKHRKSVCHKLIKLVVRRLEYLQLCINFVLSRGLYFSHSALLQSFYSGVEEKANIVSCVEAGQSDLFSKSSWM